MNIMGTIKALLLSVVLLGSVGNANTQKMGYASADGIISQMMTSMQKSLEMANDLAKAYGSDKQFSKKQIDCFTTHANDKMVDALYGQLVKEFSKDELVKLDAYFLSETGKKVRKLGGYDAIHNDKAKQSERLSLKEEKEAKTFWASKTGQKLAKLLRNQDKLEIVIKDAIAAKEQHCKMPKGGLL